MGRGCQRARTCRMAWWGLKGMSGRTCEATSQNGDGTVLFAICTQPFHQLDSSGPLSKRQAADDGVDLPVRLVVGMHDAGARRVREGAGTAQPAHHLPREPCLHTHERVLKLDHDATRSGRQLQHP